MQITGLSMAARAVTVTDRKEAQNAMRMLSKGFGHSDLVVC
jgi:hypothetical protein